MKEEKKKGLNIEGDVGYAEIKQDIDDHSTHSNRTTNDYSQDNHSIKVNKPVHDESTKNYTTENISTNTSSVRDTSNHVRTENVYMGDRHNPLYYIMPIVFIAIAAIVGVIYVAHPLQEKTMQQTSPRSTENLLETDTPKQSPPKAQIELQKADKSPITEKSSIETRMIKRPQSDNKQKTTNNSLKRENPITRRLAKNTPAYKQRKKLPAVEKTTSANIFLADDQQSIQGESCKFSLIMNTNGSDCDKRTTSTKLLRVRAIDKAKIAAAGMSRQYVDKRFPGYGLAAVKANDVHIVKVKSEGYSQSGCYQVNILAETVLYQGGLSEKKVKSLMDDSAAPLHLQIYTDRKVYHSGDKMQVFVKGNKPFFARIVYRDASNNQLQILPNRFRPENSFNGGAIYSVPDGRDRFILKMGPPFGQEEVEIYASTIPLGSVQSTDIGGMYLIEGSQEELSYATRGVDIQQAPISQNENQNQSYHIANAPITEFFESHAKLLTKAQ